MVYTQFLYRSHKNGEFYITETSVLIRALYEVGYIHHKALHDSKTHITLMGMKVGVEKSGEMQQRLRFTSLSHMDNRGKDAKDVYFGMLGYDIGTYANHLKGLSRETTKTSALETRKV